MILELIVNNPGYAGCAGESQSLTFPGIYESLLFVNRSKLTSKEAPDE